MTTSEKGFIEKIVEILKKNGSLNGFEEIPLNVKFENLSDNISAFYGWYEKESSLVKPGTDEKKKMDFSYFLARVDRFSGCENDIEILYNSGLVYRWPETDGICKYYAVPQYTYGGTVLTEHKIVGDSKVIHIPFDKDGVIIRIGSHINRESNLYRQIIKTAKSKVARLYIFLGNYRRWEMTK